MNIDAVTPLRQRMVEDMNARKLCAQTQRGHIHSCKRFAELSNSHLTRRPRRTSAGFSCIFPRRARASAIATVS